MDFKVISANRGNTRVAVVPSSPEGYFRIDDDPFLLPYAIGSITLTGVKLRHVKALQRGDISAMDRYVVTDPERSGFARFINCEPSIPDPLQPIGTSIYVRGAQEIPIPLLNA